MLTGYFIELSISCRQCESGLSALPVNRVTDSRTCDRCGTTQALDDEFWAALWPRPVEGVRDGDFPSANVGFQMNLGPTSAVCPHCDRSLERIEVDDDPQRGGLTCGACEAWTPARLAPALLRKGLPQARYVLNEEPGPGPEGVAATSQPVTFPCGTCGASLRADGSQRMMRCEYCGASNYLPDGVWQRIHAPRQPRRLYVLWEQDELELAKTGLLSPDLCRRLAASEAPQVRERLVGNDSVPSDVLAELCRDPEDSVRATLARGSRASAEMLETLSRDASPNVRAAAASNRAFPRPRLLEMARAEQDPTVLRTMANSDGEKLLRALAENASPVAQRAVVDSDDVPVDLIRALEHSTNEDVRNAARAHPASRAAEVRRRIVVTAVATLIVAGLGAGALLLGLL